MSHTDEEYGFFDAIGRLQFYGYISIEILPGNRLNIHTDKVKSFSTMLDALLTNLSKTGRSKKQALSMAVDSLLVVLSLWAAYSLRLGIPYNNFQSTWHLFVLLPICTVAIFLVFGIYRWVVRSSNEALFSQILKACVVASIALVIINFLFPADGINPRSLFVIFGMLLTLSTIGVRYVWRSFFAHGSRGEPIAIYGAGDAGRQLQQSLSQGVEFRPVLFIDDNPSIAGTMVGGLHVVAGDTSEIQKIFNSREIGRVIMAMPQMSANAYQKRVEVISNTGVVVQTIPTYVELVSGKAQLAEIRDISISDILGRTEVPPNPELLGECVRGKSVLVTGGGGSIGSELCRQILLQKPTKLIVVDHSEENLYKITEELSASIASEIDSQIDFVPCLCSVTDRTLLNDVFTSSKVDTVFHAAAYKHVPIIESYPEQGVKVNVFGTLNVLELAIEHKAKSFTLISTDKAVRPTNSMGATKRVAELILQAKAKQSNIETRISMVRFGNVLGSSGSVVPKFKSQIAANGPITITDPEITRYFMTIPEAAQLVMQASAIAKGGEVFVLHMGEPVRIEDLAVAMVKMSGKRLQRETGDPDDIEIVVKGLRPGEKMFEELFISDSFDRTKVPKVMSASEDWISWDDLSVKLNVLQENTDSASRETLSRLLLELAFIKQEEISPVDAQDSIPKSKLYTVN